ncbi:MAG: hypothetical protein GEU88_03295, partial [Solirubrobacterales bacterium]|nr:hypothetical protein [Solirubrobacterales bacterium]
MTIPTTPGWLSRARTWTTRPLEKRKQTAIKPRPRGVVAAAVGAALALAMLAPSSFAADAQILLVHGYGPSSEGKDCNGSTWENALRYYQDAGGRER